MYDHVNGMKTIMKIRMSIRVIVNMRHVGVVMSVLLETVRLALAVVSIGVGLRIGTWLCA